MNQDKVFFEKEGNNWFKRNEKVLASDDFFKKDVVLSLIEKNSLKPKWVLEIGGSNGWRLNIIAQKYKSSCIDIDPSKKAIEQGKKKSKG